MYCTAADMRELYDEQLLVQATNYSDRRATEINERTLLNACEAGDRIVDGYLMALGIPTEDFSRKFRDVLRVHAGRITMDELAATDPQIREKAKESIEWLKSLGGMTPELLINLLTDKYTEEVPIAPAVNPSVSFSEGNRWNVTDSAYGWGRLGSL